MNLLRFRRFDILVSLGCIALMASFAWYAYKGPRGFDYQATLEQQLVDLGVERDKFHAAKLALEKRVALMRPEQVDRDMLEQLARTELNLALPSEVIVKVRN
jgi:cell division protein FtsB